MTLPRTRPSRGSDRRRRSPTSIRTDPKTSARLGRIRQHGTTPELAVRRILHELGHRFRIENRDLPGSPDVANRSRGWAVFVHGCFWHRHAGCYRTTTPKRNALFWKEKFVANQVRDRRVISELRRLGFTTAVVWECETMHPDRVRRKLARRLPSPRSHEN